MRTHLEYLNSGNVASLISSLKSLSNFTLQPRVKLEHTDRSTHQPVWHVQWIQLVEQMGLFSVNLVMSGRCQTLRGQIVVGEEEGGALKEREFINYRFKRALSWLLYEQIFDSWWLMTVSEPCPDGAHRNSGQETCGEWLLNYECRYPPGKLTLMIWRSQHSSRKPHHPTKVLVAVQ